MPIALIYHDVVPAHDFDASGFPGPCAAHYKFHEDEFRRHLEAIDRVASPVSSGVGDLEPLGEPLLPCILTFDDGGQSAITTIAGMLDDLGWSGRFFITTDFLDKPGFLTRTQVRQLAERGHSIGSHSCSHPQRMSKCTSEQLADEWHRSCQILADITGGPVMSASVPGGFYSPRVAIAAAEAGIRLLFTSEPGTRPQTVNGCIVHGRYSIDRSVSVATAAAIAAGKWLPRWRQSLVWQAKKVAKALVGPLYAGLRERRLRQAHDSRERLEHTVPTTGGRRS